MELAEINGNLCYLKKDGSPSKRSVSIKSALKHYGFQAFGENIKLIEGNPKHDNIVYVKISDSRFFGNYIIKKNPEEYSKVPLQEEDYAKSIIKEQPIITESLDDLIEKKSNGRRLKVNIDEMALQVGLKVYKANNFSGYWCAEYDEFYNIPAGWDYLPKGDGALTAKVRKGIHWVFVEKKKIRNQYFTEQLGTFAPRLTIFENFNQLGGILGAEKRMQSKTKGIEKRIGNVDKRLREAVKRRFPNIPKENIESVLYFATTPGAVGRSWDIFSSKADEKDTFFDQAAYLAVRAHIRHKYTEYDELLSEHNHSYDDDIKYEIRKKIAPDIETKLMEWQ